MRPATAGQLAALTGDTEIVLPRPFVKFISDAEPRRRVRSCTACYLDLADRIVDVSGEGLLIHFLSDQQWVLHWLLYVGTDGSEAVVATGSPLGFEVDGSALGLDATDDAGVCAESFTDFLFRFWIENEIWFRLVEPFDDEPPEPPLTDEQRNYAESYLV